MYINTLIYNIQFIYNIIIHTIGRVFIAIADTRAHMHVPTVNEQDDIIIAHNEYKHIHAEVFIVASWKVTRIR